MMKCPHCHREGYEPPSNTYPSGEGYLTGLGNTRNWRFRKTGEFRAPKAGEWYLSGEIPAAYIVRCFGFSSAYHILERFQNDGVHTLPFTS